MNSLRSLCVIGIMSDSHFTQVVLKAETSHQETLISVVIHMKLIG